MAAIAVITAAITKLQDWNSAPKSGAALFQKPFKSDYANSWSSSMTSHSESSAAMPTPPKAAPASSRDEAKLQRCRGATTEDSTMSYDRPIPLRQLLHAVAEGEVVYAQREPRFKWDSKGMVATQIVTIRQDAIKKIIQGFIYVLIKKAKRRPRKNQRFK